MKKKYNKLKSIITEEFKRVGLKNNQINEYNNFIKNINCFVASNIIKEIIDFLIKIEIVNIIIILDQFKNEINIDDDEFEKKLKGIKIIVCSSLNDKNIRKSCIDYFKNILSGSRDYKNYVYISKLHNGSQYKTNKIYSYFNNIPKYISKIKNCHNNLSYRNEINSIKERIIKNIKKFSYYDDLDKYIENLIKIKKKFIFIP